MDAHLLVTFHLYSNNQDWQNGITLEFTLHLSSNNAVLAEWKPAVYDNDGGIVLMTATTRRNSPNV